MSEVESESAAPIEVAPPAEPDARDTRHRYNGPPKGLADALVRARAELGGVVFKGGRNEHNKYPFVGHEHVIIEEKGVPNPAIQTALENLIPRLRRQEPFPLPPGLGHRRVFERLRGLQPLGRLGQIGAA